MNYQQERKMRENSTPGKCVNMVASDNIGGTNFTPPRLFKMLTHFGHFTPSIRHAYSRYEHSQRQ
jgi:hypothetical protein